MLKLTVAVLAAALAGTAGAAGWRSLRLDASSAAAFEASVAMFQDKLSASRRLAFERSLQDVWLEGTRRATAEEREYTEADYYAQLDGLGYDEIIKFADPTGENAQRYRAEYYSARASGSKPPSPGFSQGPAPPPVNSGVYRGWTTNGGIRIGADYTP